MESTRLSYIGFLGLQRVGHQGYTATVSLWLVRGTWTSASFSIPRFCALKSLVAHWISVWHYTTPVHATSGVHFVHSEASDTLGGVSVEEDPADALE